MNTLFGLLRQSDLFRDGDCEYYCQNVNTGTAVSADGICSRVYCWSDVVEIPVAQS
jgi:hypothetical protein